MNCFTRRSALAGIAVVTLVVAGCSSGDDSMAMSTTSSAGRSAAGSSAPMTSMTSMNSMSDMPDMSDMADMSTDATDSAAAGAEHNAADVTFASMMIEHHRSAIEMAQLAPDRAAGPEVKDLAARIEAAQAPEIESMTGWLDDWGTAMPGMSTGGVDMGTGAMGTGSTGGMAMPGMMTADQMAALTAATGAGFDRMFLELMIEHHQGAVEMADTELAAGANADALALAESIRTSQTGEIAEMQALLQGM